MILSMAPHSDAKAFADAIAAEIRAEMARQNKTQAQLAEVLGVRPITISRRLKGSPPFDTVEIFQVAEWLGVRPTDFYPAAPTPAVSA